MKFPNFRSVGKWSSCHSIFWTATGWHLDGTADLSLSKSTLFLSNQNKRTIITIFSCNHGDGEKWSDHLTPPCFPKSCRPKLATVSLFNRLSIEHFDLFLEKSNWKIRAESLIKAFFCLCACVCVCRRDTLTCWCLKVDFRSDGSTNSEV